MPTKSTIQHCQKCQKPLSGRQRRFCCTACRNAYWQATRLSGEALQLGAGVEPDQLIQAMINEILHVLSIHKEAVEMIALRQRPPQKTD